MVQWIVSALPDPGSKEAVIASIVVCAVVALIRGVWWIRSEEAKLSAPPTNRPHQHIAVMDGARIWSPCPCEVCQQWLDDVKRASAMFHAKVPSS